MQNMFKVNNKTPEWRQWRRYSAFVVSFEYISLFFTVSIFDFEQVNVSWDGS